MEKFKGSISTGIFEKDTNSRSILLFRKGEGKQKDEKYKFFLQSVQQDLAEKRHNPLLEQ